MKIKQALLLALLALCALPSALSTAKAQGTAFTYQGQLSAGGNPANGQYDFTFALFNNNSTNTGQVGGTLTDLDVGVTNGLFIVGLDFGANFPGASRWLAIGVRTNGAASFTALNPLQEVTPTPYAIYTPNAGSAATANAVAAANITGVISLAQLPGAVVTNNAPSATLDNLTLNGSLNLPADVPIISAGGGQLMYANDIQNNFFSGLYAGNLATDGNNNTATGIAALMDNTGGNNNTAIGYSTLASLVRSGNNNTALGSEALGQLGLVNNTGGTNNIALGYQAGYNLFSNESGNIDLGSPGVTGENNTIRIGTPGIQTNVFIAGVINGNGGGLTNLNAAALTGILSNLSGASLTSLTAANITPGGTLPVLNGANLTNLNASQLTSIGSQDNNLGNDYANFFVGPQAGNATGTGSYNTALGFATLIENTTGSQNTADGVFALEHNTTGSFNTAYGLEALAANTTGSNNTAFGDLALQGNIVGNNNTAVGYLALAGFDESNGGSGSNNIALGFAAGAGYTGTESSNIDIGYGGSQGENYTIHIGTPGVQTIAYIAGVITGNGAGLTNLTNLNASQLASIGSQDNTLGNDYANFFVGPQAGNATGTGSYNTALGFATLIENTTGSQNTADGVFALEHNTTGSFNTAYGLEALAANTTGSNNTAFGDLALQGNIVGNNNTAVGYLALAGFDENNSESGSNNIALGYAAGAGYTGTESSNIDIGYIGSQGENYTIHIGTPGVQTIANIAGVITGNGNGLTNLNAAKLTGGPLPGGVLPANVALLNGTQTFTGANTFTNSLTVNTGAGTLTIENDLGVVPGITATGGLATGHMRMRNGVEVWPDPALANSGYLDVRNTATIATISLTGSSGAIVCSNVTANGMLLTSDRNAKQNFTPLDPQTVLAKVSAIPVTEWSYKSGPAATKHIGPMAQDFHAAFGLNGGDDTHISVVDEGGVALAAIQGLNQKLNEKDAEIQALKQSVAELKMMVQTLAGKK